MSVDVAVAAGMTVVVKLEGSPQLCKTDEVGELCLSCGYCATGYWGLPGVSNSVFKACPLCLCLCTFVLLVQRQVESFNNCACTCVLLFLQIFTGRVSEEGTAIGYVCLSVCFHCHLSQLTFTLIAS